MNSGGINTQEHGEQWNHQDYVHEMQKNFNQL